jgi:hypothetical protein
MCRACEASNRDCTYPQPVMSGTPRATANTVAVNSVGTSNQIAGGNADRTEVRIILVGKPEIEVRDMLTMLK